MISVKKPNKIYHSAFKIQYPRVVQALISDVQVSDFQDRNHFDFKAIWDTGATHSVITKKVVDQLGLIPTGMTKVLGVNSSSEQPTI